MGSVYFGLDRLAEEGKVQRLGGDSPAQTVYRITPAGSENLSKLLKNLWANPERVFHKLDIALHFSHLIDREELILGLESILHRTVVTLSALEARRGEAKNPPIARAIFEHSRVHIQAERDWLEGVLQGLKDGTY